MLESVRCNNWISGVSKGIDRHNATITIGYKNEID